MWKCLLDCSHPVSHIFGSWFAGRISPCDTIIRIDITAEGSWFWPSSEINWGKHHNSKPKTQPRHAFVPSRCRLGPQTTLHSYGWSVFFFCVMGTLQSTTVHVFVRVRADWSLHVVTECRGKTACMNRKLGFWPLLLHPLSSVKSLYWFQTQHYPVSILFSIPPLLYLIC